ncbi:unnamed protein product [Closterium sp. Naga37s-1]|nr:unnamed protein product [Closterium sp. Naga37s-1]
MERFKGTCAAAFLHSWLSGPEEDVEEWEGGEARVEAAAREEAGVREEGEAREEEGVREEGEKREEGEAREEGKEGKEGEELEAEWALLESSSRNE